MGRRVLITGGSRGIGAACAYTLARDGMNVLINCREHIEQAETLASKLNGTVLPFDVADPDAVDAAMCAAGNVDVVVANAGIALQNLLTDTTTVQWRRLFAVNVEGVFNVCRRAIPHMVQEKWGRIIVISSMWGLRGASCEVAYSTSKAALIGFTKALAKELGPSGITVNCVAPGVIDTDMNRSLDGDVLAALADDTPLMRLGTPEDVAELVAFLASDKASFITGQIIAADGGFAV